MGDHHPGAVEDLNLGFGLADLELATNVARWDLEAEGVHVDVALEVDDAGMEPIDGRAPGGERTEAMALGGKEVAATRVELAAEGGVDLGAPGEGLAVGVIEVLKLASDEEVVLHVVEQAFDDGGAVGVALLVGVELEAAGFGEGSHLGDGDH